MSNLYYTVKDLKTFRSKDVLISGGGNTAVDWAHDLSGIASSITLDCRKSELKGHEAMVDKLDKDNIRVIKGASIDTLITNDDEDTIRSDQLTDANLVHLIASCFTEVGMDAEVVKTYMSGGDVQDETIVSNHNEDFDQKNKEMNEQI